MPSVLHLTPAFMDGFARTCFDNGISEDDAEHMFKAARAETTFYGRLILPLIKLASGPGAPSSSPVASAAPKPVSAAPAALPITGLNQKATTAPIPPPTTPKAPTAPAPVTPVSTASGAQEAPQPTSAAGNNAKAWKTWGANPTVAPPLGLKDHNGNQVTGNNQWSTPGGGQINATAAAPDGQVTARKMTSPHGTGSATMLSPTQFAQRKPGVFTDTVDGKPTQMSFDSFKGMRDEGKWSDMLRSDPALAAANPMLASDTHLADGTINPVGEAMQRSLRFKTMQDMPKPSVPAPQAPAVVPSVVTTAAPPVLPKVPAPIVAAPSTRPALAASKLSPAEQAEYLKNKGKPYSALPPLPASPGAEVAGFTPKTPTLQ